MQSHAESADGVETPHSGHLAFEVHSDPKPQPRARARVVPLGNGKFRAGVYNAAGKSASFRADVIEAIRRVGGEDLKLSGPLVLALAFRFRRPAGHYRTGKNAGKLREAAPPLPTGKNSGDYDNLGKLVTDALMNAGVIEDDAQIVMAAVMKQYCEGDERPGVGVIVTKFGANATALRMKWNVVRVMGIGEG